MMLSCHGTIQENGEPYTIRQCIGEAVGLASMCWKPAPDAVFDSEMASRIVDEVLANIDAYVDERIQQHKESQIAKAEATAMRPGQENVMTPPRDSNYGNPSPIHRRHRDDPGYEDKPTINRAVAHPVETCTCALCTKSRNGYSGIPMDGDRRDAIEMENLTEPFPVPPMYKCDDCGAQYDARTQYISCPHDDHPLLKRRPIKDNPQA